MVSGSRITGCSGRAVWAPRGQGRALLPHSSAALVVFVALVSLVALLL